MGHTYIAKEPSEDGSIHYTAEENLTWNKLITRQKKIIVNRACKEFVKGVDILNFSENKVPDYREVNQILESCTGWGVQPVPAVIPAKDFFTLLANKKFPAASFIRIPEELDYLEEPDIFHELFGHCPLLTDQGYADFMEEYAKLALSVSGKERARLFRLFWFTIEFGLVNTVEGLRTYGGGILSSKGETVYSLESDVPVRESFDRMNVLRTPFRIDIIQPKYFILDRYEDLYNILSGDVIADVRESIVLGDHPALFKKEDAIKIEDEYVGA